MEHLTFGMPTLKTTPLGISTTTNLPDHVDSCCTSPKSEKLNGPSNEREKVFYPSKYILNTDSPKWRLLSAKVKNSTTIGKTGKPNSGNGKLSGPSTIGNRGTFLSV
jgi:hypothetical protein